MFASVVGLMGSVIAYLAGRHRWLIKAYRDLIEDLRAEVNRLREYIQDLESTIRAPRRASRGTSQKIGAAQPL